MSGAADPRPAAGPFHVPPEKIVAYLLDPAHRDGGPKARFFLARGFTVERWEHFAEALCAHGGNQTLTRVVALPDGEKWEVRCEMQTPDGRNPCVLSVWLREGAKAPQLVTAYPNPPPKLSRPPTPAG